VIPGGARDNTGDDTALPAGLRGLWAEPCGWAARLANMQDLTRLRTDINREPGAAPGADPLLALGAAPATRHARSSRRYGTRRPFATPGHNRPASSNASERAHALRHALGHFTRKKPQPAHQRERACMPIPSAPSPV